MKVEKEKEKKMQNRGKKISFTKEEPKEHIEMKKATKILTGCVKIKLNQTQH